jgi:hypothetical protein
MLATTLPVVPALDDYECGAVGGKSGRGNLSNCRLSAKLAPTFADRGCHMVSAMDPYGHILCFLDRSSSIVLTRLSEPCSRPTTQKIW